MASPLRVILTEDGGTLAGWPSPPTRQTIEELVAGYAGQGIDVLSYGLGGAHNATYDSRVLYRQWLDELEDQSQTALNARHMAESGVDLPAVLADAAHGHGLLFWPVVRMNNTARTHSPAHDEHPEWFFDGYAAMYGFRDGYRPMMNYELEEVREFMMCGFRELVEDYDADGLQLDFTRYPSLFKLDRAHTLADLLTDYLASVRAMLDEVAKKKGRRLTLALQVLCHPWQALPYGHDVRTWIQQGIADYVLPTQPNNVDCNLPVDKWMEIVEGTDCQVFPTIHPYFRFYWTNENRSTLESLRAAAHLYYQQGAHGLSTVNMFDALQNEWFRQLRDPNQIARGPHHYRYTFDADSSTDLSLRPDNLIWRVSTPVRIVDDPATLKGKLRLTVENLVNERELTIFLNAVEVPRLNRGGHEAYPVFPSERQSISFIEIALSQLDLKRGENRIGFSFNSERTTNDWVHIREVEILAEVEG